MFYHALKIIEEQCIGCTHCISVCPTEALRIKHGKAYLIPERCVDCGRCMRACPYKAIIVEQDDFNQIFNYKIRVALIPAVFIGQFPRNIPVRSIYQAILTQGFTNVFEAELGAGILQELITELYDSKVKPVISSFCPSIVRLIQVKFPSLIENIMLLRSPLYITARAIFETFKNRGYKSEEIGIFYVTPCASKIADIKNPENEDSCITGVINMNFLYNKIFGTILTLKDNNQIVEKQQLKDFEMLWSLTGGESSHARGRSLAIDGIINVIEFLEKLENSPLGNFDFLELRACDQSCAGGILTVHNRFLTSERLFDRARIFKVKYADKAVESSIIDENKSILIDYAFRKNIIKENPMIVDNDISEGIKKIMKIRDIQNILPLLDCGICGSPSCKVFAEDVILQKIDLKHCLFYNLFVVEKENKMYDELRKTIKEIWGNKKFENYES